MVKSNLYSAAQIEDLRKELYNVTAYLENLDLFILQDEIGWKSSTTGKMMPSIISTIEKQIQTCVEVIAQSTAMITTIYEQEGMDDILKSQIDATIKKLNDLRDYYFKQDINKIQNRILEISNGFTKKGEPKFISLVVASADDQRSKRGSILQRILKVLPAINKIEDYKKATARGGMEISESLERFLIRKKNE